MEHQSAVGNFMWIQLVIFNVSIASVNLMECLQIANCFSQRLHSSNGVYCIWIPLTTDSLYFINDKLKFRFLGQTITFYISASFYLSIFAYYTERNNKLWDIYVVHVSFSASYVGKIDDRFDAML